MVPDAESRYTCCQQASRTWAVAVVVVELTICMQMPSIICTDSGLVRSKVMVNAPIRASTAA